MALTTNLLDSLQSDLRTISNEAKRKLPPLKEAAEAGIIKVRAVSNMVDRSGLSLRQALYEDSVRIVEPFIMACEFNKQNQKIVQISLGAVQRLITFQALSPTAACNFVDCLWTLMENNTEELKVLQTVTLLVSTNGIVTGAALAKSLVLCFRLHFTKSPHKNVASATIRQLVANIIERVENEDKDQLEISASSIASGEPSSANKFIVQPLDMNELHFYVTSNMMEHGNKFPQQYAPKSLKPAAADAFLLMRDLIQLVKAEQPYWLVGMTEMTRTFGLELLEIVFISYSDTLARHEEFKYLIKKKVCPMILKLFSPDISYEDNDNQSTLLLTKVPDSTTNKDQKSAHSPNEVEESVVANISSDQPINATSMRILRILSMLIQKFYCELINRSEIFMSIFVKLTESDTSLKQVTGGPLKLARLSSADTGTAGTTISSVTTSEVPVLTTMISKLFENSPLLDEPCLLKLVDELCKLSSDTIEGHSLATTDSGSLSASPTSASTPNREPSPYIIVKLLEIGLVNLHRIDVIWKPLTNHFLEVIHHPHLRIREWGADALTHLIKQASCHLQQQHRNLKPLPLNQRVLLRPLQSLSTVSHQDIRQKQLDAVLQIIQSTSGDSLLSNNESMGFGYGGGWPQLIDIIGTVDEMQNENLIRIAFQCLQLIVSDYLSTIDSKYIILVIAGIVKFASQTQELNVSLTAIGLLWNVADYLYQNRNKIIGGLTRRDTDQIKKGFEEDAPNLAFIHEYMKQSDLTDYDAIWMASFSKLSEICIDARPAIRKSACQTLFATITTHGSILEAKTWQAVLWQVLFPLLNQVRTNSGLASDVKIQQSTGSGLDNKENYDDLQGEILLHHTRNTAQKQWSETQVLALSGVTKVFTTKRDNLLAISKFPNAWKVLLEFIKTASLSKVSEVSLAALKSFQELLTCCNASNASARQKQDKNRPLDTSQDLALWLSAWNTWCTIGMEVTQVSGFVDKAKPIVSTISESSEPQLLQDLATQCNKIRASNGESRPLIIPSPEQANVLTIPSQTYLLNYVKIFLYLHSNIKAVFKATEFKRVCQVLDRCLSVPITDHDISSIFAYQTMPLHHINHNNPSSSSSATCNPGGQSDTVIHTTPLHNAVLEVMGEIEKDLLARHSNEPPPIPVNSATQSIQRQNIPVKPIAEGLQIENNQNESTEQQHIVAGDSANLPQSSDQQIIDDNWRVSIENEILPVYFEQLAKFFTYSFIRTECPIISIDQRPVIHQPDQMMMPNSTPFAEKCLKNLVTIYRQFANNRVVIQSQVLHSIVVVMQDAPQLKQCPLHHSTWKLAVLSLLNILQVGLNVARKYPEQFVNLWADLALCLELFLFPNVTSGTTGSNIVGNNVNNNSRNQLPLGSCLSNLNYGEQQQLAFPFSNQVSNSGRIMKRSTSNQSSPSLSATTTSSLDSTCGSDVTTIYNAQLKAQDEGLDVKIVEFIRDRILPNSSSIPKEFVLQIVTLLNRGSIHSPTINILPVCLESTSVRLREDFARCCFETLLQFSFFGPQGNPELFINESLPPEQNVGIVNKLAVNCLLQRFSDVIIKFNHDERLAGKCPLPRHRMSEISFVLKAMATLLLSLKKVPPEVVGKSVWNQVISLYPHLVDCATRDSPAALVQRSLNEVLHEYASLLASPPANIEN